ncbi:hypothetical protein BVY03_05230 [bacterium K02(2017)]|nr:hypothetical protein BVY03_05230 [bacterium K02(2017)]
MSPTAIVPHQLPFINLPHITRIGHDILPPAMRTHMQQVKSQQLKVNQSGLLAPIQHLFNYSVNTSKGFVGQAQMLWDSFRYSRHVKQLKKSYTQDLPADKLVRLVYDANGHPKLPPDAKLELAEEGVVPHNQTSQVPEANDAYNNAGFVFDFFKEHLGVNISQPLVQVVNFNDDILNTGYQNAFYTPMMLGAHLVIYGKGDDKLFNSPASSIEIVGHEFTHFYLDQMYGEKFFYQGQSGAINEHLADVVGMSIKAKHEGLDGNNYSDEFWHMGANWMIEPGMGIRHMLHPGTAYSHSEYGKDSQPAHMKDFDITPYDQGGVHINSGILNRVFALFANSVNSPLHDLPLKIWLRAAQTVGAQPDFREFAEALVLSARELDQYPNTKGLDLEKKILAACKKTGVLDYVVRGKQMVKAP